jgi:hypothetical protein
MAVNLVFEDISSLFAVGLRQHGWSDLSDALIGLGLLPVER